MIKSYKRTEPDPTLEEFGGLMRKYRRNRSLTVEEVAARLKISTSALNNWETGMTAPGLLAAIAWCEFLGADLWPHLPGEP